MPRSNESVVPDCRTRPAVYRDLRAVAAIERAVFPDPWSHGMFAAHLRYGPPEMFLVAESPDGALLGYALMRAVMDESELLNIAVAPSARRRGVGIALLRAAMATCAAHGAERMLLEVRQSNVAARALYEAHGFAAVGRRRGYYHSPREDAVIMRAEMIAAASERSAAAEAAAPHVNGNESLPRVDAGLPEPSGDSILSSASKLPRQEIP
jgi:ribosomal-protein-alanine N-acetyltransferase